MKKKICVFCSVSSFNTGMPISTYKLVAGLIEGGRFEVCAVLPGEGELAERLRAAGARVDIIPFNRVRGGAAGLLRFLATWFRAGVGLYRYVRKNGVDIVHFSDMIDAPFYPWARLAGVKAVAHVRVCLGGRAVRFLYRSWTSFFCGGVIAISEFTRRYYGFCRKRAEVVYNPGPDRKIFDAAWYFDNTPRVDVPAVIAVSMFRRDKGLHNFVRIAAEINKRLDGKVKFIIVGGKIPGHEKYYDEVIGSARRLGLFNEGRLTVTGNVPHERIPEIMSRSAILLHVPEWEEALGGVILEAMAMGVVPVAYNRGGVGECFTNGESGFLIAKGDINDAALKIETIINDASLRAKLSEAARVHVAEKFSMRSYIGSVEKIYTRVFRRSESRHVR